MRKARRMATRSTTMATVVAGRMAVRATVYPAAGSRLISAGAWGGGGRGEDVAARERGAGGGQLVLVVGQRHGAAGAAGHRHRRGQQTVVGTDEVGLAVGALHGDGPALAADPGVDHAEHHAQR